MLYTLSHYCADTNFFNIHIVPYPSRKHVKIRKIFHLTIFRLLLLKIILKCILYTEKLIFVLRNNIYYVVYRYAKPIKNEPEIILLFSCLQPLQLILYQRDYIVKVVSTFCAKFLVNVFCF